MGVNHCGADVAMTKQLLDDAKARRLHGRTQSALNPQGDVQDKGR